MSTPMRNFTTPETFLSSAQRQDIISSQQLENSVSSILDSPCITDTPTTSRRPRRTRQSKNSESSAIPLDVLDDLCLRFINTIPDSEKNDPVRVCFQVEQAHWFYIDYYCEKKQLPGCSPIGFKEFIRCIFLHSSFLSSYRDKIDAIVDEFRQYKSLIPVCGAVLFDSELSQILLVQGYFASRNTWGFPKGKVNQDEDPKACAIREVFEETGYDITSKIVDDVTFTYTFNDTMVNLYVVVGVEHDFQFKPHLRKEIRKIAWFPINELPKHRADFDTCCRDGFRPNNFYGVIPAMNFIRKFVADRTKQTMSTRKSSAFHPVKPKSQTQLLPSLPPQQYDSSLLENFLLRESGTPKPVLNSQCFGPSASYPSFETPTTEPFSQFVMNLPAEDDVSDLNPQSTGEEWLSMLLPQTRPKPPSLTGVQNSREFDVQSEDSRLRPIRHPIPISSSLIMHPSLSQDRMLQSDHISSSFHSTPRGKVDTSISSGHMGLRIGAIELCNAWKDFKLDISQLNLNPMPS